MKKLPFKSSAIASVGVELEIQIINPNTFDMKSSAKTLIHRLPHNFEKRIKPEITQSMIEINSSIHLSIQTLYDEFCEIRKFLLDQASELQILFAGGGTHPFQKWSRRKIFPTKRFKNLSRIYQYLSKQSTVFGEHVHIGCGSGEEALFLTHAMGRFVPQFIALSASSPYYQSVDTGYHSTRSTIFNAFPMSGFIPYLTNWQEFCEYYYKMRNFGIIHSMKDFYWDVRPKPEFGTVEIRVFDTPLSIKKAVLLAAYAQSLALYLLQERPFLPTHDLYFLYNYNRFQASRYGFEGEFIDPYTYERRSIAEDTLQTLQKIQKYITQLKNDKFIAELTESIIKQHNDVTTIRHIMKQVQSLPKLVSEIAKIWEQE